MHRVSFLPQEFGRTEERSCRLFPTNDVTPLIVELGKVSVGMNYVFIMLTEKRLRGRTNYKTLTQMILTAYRNDSTLGSKSLNVILLSLKKALGYEHRHIYVLMSKSLESCIEIVLDILPYCISVRTDYHTSLYARIISKLCFLYNVGIPLSKVNVHRRDLLNHFFIVCHLFLSFRIIYTVTHNNIL